MENEIKPMPDHPRSAALLVLNDLYKTLDRVLEDTLDEHPGLSRRDRAFLQALVYGVLRWRARLDWTIAHFSKTRLRKVDPVVLNILRLGLFQIIYLSKVPVFAAVDTAVEMAKSVAPPWIQRYVNGLLRNAARKYQEVSFPDIDKDPVSALAVKKSFPKWLIKRWIHRFGLRETGFLCDAINTIPPITARANLLKTNREKLIQSLQGLAENISSTNYAPDGVCFSNPKTKITELNAFKEGLFQVQDEAAQLVTLLLNPRPGETILDACAGLGGKTGHILQEMKNKGRLLALDVDEKKLVRLELEMKRLGVSAAETWVHDLNHPITTDHMGRFDRILLDAPCSGLGVLRKNPDAKWTSSIQDLIQHQKRQVLFLSHVAPLVKPSGCLVYAVCSTEPEENESVIDCFLSKYINFTVDNNPTGLPAAASSLVDKNGYLKTFPHLNNMDGFFSVCLKRTK
jgi:16S rRNA (cytosine967-C5)-methyltransferase